MYFENGYPYPFPCIFVNSAPGAPMPYGLVRLRPPLLPRAGRHDRLAHRSTRVWGAGSGRHHSIRAQRSRDEAHHKSHGRRFAELLYQMEIVQVFRSFSNYSQFFTVNGNYFRFLTAKDWANLDNPIKSYDFTMFWLISCMPPSHVALCEHLWCHNITTV